MGAAFGVTLGMFMYSSIRIHWPESESEEFDRTMEKPTELKRIELNSMAPTPLAS